MFRVNISWLPWLLYLYNNYSFSLMEARHATTRVSERGREGKTASERNGPLANRGRESTVLSTWGKYGKCVATKMLTNFIPSAVTIDSYYPNIDNLELTGCTVWVNNLKQRIWNRGRNASADSWALYSISCVQSYLPMRAVVCLIVFNHPQ